METSEPRYLRFDHIDIKLRRVSSECAAADSTFLLRQIRKNISKLLRGACRRNSICMCAPPNQSVRPDDHDASR